MTWLKRILMGGRVANPKADGDIGTTTAANAAETEVAMSDPVTAPPAISGGITKADLEALLKPLAETVASLAAGHKSLAEGQKALQEAVKATGSPVKPEDVAKAVSDQLDARQKAAGEASAKQTARDAVRAKVVAAKLPGVDPALINLPDTDDEAVLTAAATKLRGVIEKLPGVKLPDVGGVANNGGTTPAAAKPGEGAAQKYTSANTGLSDGMAKYASSIELPK